MTRTLLKKVFKYLKHDKITLISSIVLSIFIVTFTIYTPILFGQAIDNIIDYNNVNMSNVISIILKAIIIILITAILQWFQMLLNNKMAYRINKKMRKDIFVKIQNLPISYLDKNQHGKLVNIIINDVDQFSDGLLLGFTQAFSGIATIIGTIIIMLLINWLIAIVVIVLTPLSLFVAKFITKNTYTMFKQQSIIKAEQTGFIDEMIGNIKVVEAFNHENANLEKFDKINLELEKCSLKAVFYSSLTNPCTRFINSIIYALVCLVGAIFIINPFISGMSLTVGLLTSLLSYANQYTKPFNEISSVIAELQNSFACASRVFEVLEEEEIIDVDKNIALVNGNVQFENVSFSYDPNISLIKNLNLKVKQGMHVAIVGPTGCGKTTLINLLMRFYDPNTGSIFIDNHNVIDISRKSVRDNFGMVLQDTWIKNASIKDNICLGDNSFDINEIIEACKKAHCHGFIKRLKNGYDTKITDDSNLSNGQKQLLSIARIMLLQPPMLILDEATSSIDTRTEIKIQKAFATLMENKTTFIVAHRLSTIINSDLIIVMNDGDVIEQGTHDELLKLKGFYYKLYNSQFAK